jgi:predicted esterase
MPSSEKRVSFQASNSYSTLNELTPDTKNLWFACHGLGYLSRYFIRYFDHLNKEENYIISPQAPSKYYQGKDFKYVGASWLTRENTLEDTQNVLAYLDAVWEAEKSPPPLAGQAVGSSSKQSQVDCKRIFFGYSQGVSVVMRWMASRKIEPDVLAIHSGGIPKELNPDDFEFLSKTKVYLIYGKQDEYLTENRIEEETGRAKALFGNKLEIIPFEGKHEVNRKLIEKISNFK